MSRTILEIAKEAAERDATAPAPSALFNTNNRISRILRQAAADTVREYLRTSGWQGFSELQSAWVFSLMPGRFAYQLPPDYLRIIPRTEQRDGWAMGLVGPSNPQNWARWVHGGFAVAAPLGWRIKNNALFVEPTPSSAELVVIEYISKYPVISELRVGDYNLDGSIPVTNAPFVPRDGHLVEDVAPLLEQQASTDGQFGEQPGYDDATWPSEPMEILKRIDPQSSVKPLPQVRRPELAADTDRLAFEDDHLISLGMTYRLRRALGKPYAEQAAEYEEEMEIKGATDAGGPRGFGLGTSDDLGGAVPLGGAQWLVD